MSKLFTFLLLVVSFSVVDAQLYKSMMDDYSVNFYDVVAEAEKYFEGKEKGKGTGWGPYQRWKNRTESLFYPSGDRSQYNPFIAFQAYEKIKSKSSPTKSNPAYNWKDLGPYSIDSITFHYAPGLGRVECVYVDPLNEQTMYMSSRSGGFWRSTDGGSNWLNTTDVLTVSGVNTFAVNPNNINDILINTRNARNGTTHGVYRSMDGGLSWTMTIFHPLSGGIGGLGTNSRVQEIIFNKHQSDTIFIATTDGLYRSIDNLSSIQMVRSGSYGQVELHPTNANVVYLSYDYYWDRNKFLKSTDGGTSWTNTVTIAANSNSYPKLSTSLDEPNSLFFTSGNGIWKSTDQGISFSFIANSNNFGSTFGVSEDDADVFLKGVLDVYRSSDGGANWTQATEWYLPSATVDNYIHADMRYLYFTNGTFYVGTDGFFVKTSDNGVSWTILSSGTSIRENYKLGVSQTHKDIVACGSQDNGSSFYNEGIWKEYIGADGMEQIIHPMNPDWAVGSIQNGNKQRTKNRAESVSGINSHPSFKRNWEAPLAYNTSYFNTIYGLGDTLVKSEDWGTNWEIIYDFGTEVIQQFAIAENNEQIMLASYREKLYKSTDGGSTFNRIAIADLPGNTIQDIAFDPNDDNRIIVVYNQYQDNDQRIYISSNGGGSFSNISHNLSAIPAHTVVIDHSDSSYIYIGTEIGVYVKSLSASTYQLFSNNMPPVAIEELEINYAANSIKAVSWGRGLWENCLFNRDGYISMLKIEMDQDGAVGVVEGVDNFLSVTVDDVAAVDSLYIKYSINSQALSQTIHCTKLNSTTIVSNETLPNGMANDTVFFKVFAKNFAGDLTESYTFMYYVNAIEEYCAASGDGATVDWIDLVELGTQNNPSGKTGYSNFLSVIFDIDQFASDSLGIRLNHVFSGDKTGAWVDWNKSNSFEESERIAMGAFNVNDISKGLLKVPDTAEPGKYVLRVRNSFFGTEAQPCGTSAGEVEDYTILVHPACSSNSVVSNVNNFGEGSLRYYVDKTCVGDTIQIDPLLASDSIVIYGEQIVITDSLTILGPLGQHFVLSGNSNFRIFDISAPLNLANLTLRNGSTTPDGGAFRNSSKVELRNVILEDNFEATIRKPFSNTGEVIVIPGETLIKE